MKMLMHDHVNIDYELLISEIKKYKPKNWYMLYMFILRSDFNKSELTVSNYSELDQKLSYFDKIIEVLSNLYQPIKEISDRKKEIDIKIDYNMQQIRKIKAVYFPPLQK